MGAYQLFVIFAVMLGMVAGFFAGMFYENPNWAGHAQDPTKIYSITGSNLTTTFNENGLPTGTNWTVVAVCIGAGMLCRNYSASGNSTSLSLVVPSNAVYQYTISGPSGFSASPNNLTFSGSEVAITPVTFTDVVAAQTHRTMLNQTAQKLAVGGAIGVASVVLGWLVARRVKERYVVDGIPIRFVGNEDDYELRTTHWDRSIYFRLEIQEIDGQKYENDTDLAEVDVVLPWDRGVF